MRACQKDKFPLSQSLSTLSPIGLDANAWNYQSEGKGFNPCLQH